MEFRRVLFRSLDRDPGGRGRAHLDRHFVWRRPASGAGRQDHGYRAAVSEKRNVVTQAELDTLVAQIGEEILARVGRPETAPVTAPKKGEGLNLPDQVCPGCVQRCAQTCSRNTKEIIAVGATRISASERLTKIDPSIAALIDHTVLKPEATRADIIKVCREARQYNFASVCVNSYWVPLVRAELAGSAVKICTVD